MTPGHANEPHVCAARQDIKYDLQTGYLLAIPAETQLGAPPVRSNDGSAPSSEITFASQREPSTAAAAAETAADVDVSASLVWTDGWAQFVARHGPSSGDVLVLRLVGDELSVHFATAEAVSDKGNSWAAHLAAQSTAHDEHTNAPTSASLAAAADPNPSALPPKLFAFVDWMRAGYEPSKAVSKQNRPRRSRTLSAKARDVYGTAEDPNAPHAPNESASCDKSNEALPEAKSYFPSLEEFRNPIEYVASIRGDAEAYGIARIVPPKGWQQAPALQLDTPLLLQATRQDIARLMDGTPFADGGVYTAAEYRAVADACLREWASKQHSSTSVPIDVRVVPSDARGGAARGSAGPG